MAEITMPQLGETVTEGTITRWAKQVGERVEEDEVLFEVSTDKVDSEVPAPTSGFVTEILVPEGETVEVGAKLAVISDEAPSGDGKAAAAPAKEAKPEAEPEAEAEADSEPAEADAEESQDTTEAVEESQAGTPETEQPKAKEAPKEQPEPAANGGGSKVLSPVVRRLLAEHNLDANQISGTGAGGRITRADVLALVEGKGAPA